MKLRSVDYGSLKGKKVLVRVDFNVPLKNGSVTDDTRIKAHKSTIKKLQDSGAIVAMVSHLGRPKGKTDPKYTLEQIVPAVESVLGPLTFVKDCVGDAVKDAVSKASSGDLLLLENTRFYPEEEKNDEAFSKKMASPFDAFVLDAFSASHRAHSSTVGVQSLLKSYSGELLENEISSLSRVQENPEKPFVLILGGAKVSDKIGVIENLMEKASSILILGGMSFTFLKASGASVGNSLVDSEHLEFAKSMMEKAKSLGVKVVLPKDTAIGSSVESNGGDFKIVSAEAIPDGMMGLDIGPETVKLCSETLKGAKTILWNGPAGVFENQVYAKGTLGICQAVADATVKGAFSVVGGGDTASAVSSMGFKDKMSHVSTGGGASLEFCEGKVLPGVAPLIQ